MKCQESNNPSLDRYFDVESSGDERSSSSSEISAREHCVGEDFVHQQLRVLVIAIERQRAAMRGAYQRISRALAASIDVVRLTVQSKFPSRARVIEQRIRAPCGARDRDQKRGSSGQRLRASDIPMCSHIRQLVG